MKHFKPFLLSIVILLSVAINLNAQEHLKFMGIPLTGSIDNFQKRLATKGIKPLTWFNKTTPFGTRAFEGMFTGKMCEIYVYYTEQKIVYRAKAVYSDKDENFVDQYYNSIKGLLTAKYEDEHQETNTNNGYEEFDVLVTDNIGVNSIGCIQLYKGKFDDEWGNTLYSIHVDYVDFTNSAKHNNDNMDDL